MINFLHKPCCADGDKASEISERIKNKCKNVKINDLENLLNLRLGTKKIPFIKMTEIIDFPQYSESEMIEKIFFGSYYVHRSKSYLADIIENNNCAIIDEAKLAVISLKSSIAKKLISALKHSKIIGMEMPSRHKRSLKSKTSGEGIKDFRFTYKVYIQFTKNAVLSK